ncbi:MAG TPA: trimeric intracellular cation channel family protein [Thermomicrobiales bacterium]|nr:trimeric intracellular cation channel family protein [Thermomicrobiales bacterium]
MGHLELFDIVDLMAVFIGALTGALVARRLRYDITGHWTLALISGLGGGIIRDVLIASGPPLALTVPAYLPTVLVAAMVSALFGSRIDQLRKTILVVDAVSIANFAVAGSLRAIDAGLAVWPILLLGVITAVGGGVIREVMIGETPTVFRRSELYATAALGTCLAVVVLHSLGSPRAATVIACMAFGTFLRLGSVRWGWMSWQPK